MLIVFTAGFTPIPFKIFTISSGVMGLPLLPFLGALLVGRAGRFFLVGALIYYLASLSAAISTVISTVGLGIYRLTCGRLHRAEMVVLKSHRRTLILREIVSAILGCTLGD
ncbi:MAG: hypothetical protein R3C68_18870 [Myxococcota bacterium]